MKFKLGDKVKWSSQSQGFRRDKQGVVVQVVGILERPNHEQFQTLYRGCGCGYGRTHESYVVNTAQPNRAPKYYWPVASLLSLSITNTDESPMPVKNACD
jgi:hypothetical protein